MLINVSEIVCVEGDKGMYSCRAIDTKKGEYEKANEGQAI